MNNSQKLLLLGLAIALLVGAAAAGSYFGPKLTPSYKVSQQEYTYNIKAKIVGITGVFNPNSTTNKFKYIVCVAIDKDEKPEIVEASKNTAHVLPPLNAGTHCVPIPDSDMVGYIDWRASQEMVASPIDSAGIKIYNYKLYDWVRDSYITLTCHEVIGSAGAAELVCSEY